MFRLGIFLTLVTVFSLNMAEATPVHHKKSTRLKVHHVKHVAQLHRTRHAVTEEIPISDIAGFSSYPKGVKELINESLTLSQRNLTYQFGSANPKNGGLDCSGAIYYLLNRTNNFEPPRQAYELYKWVENQGGLHLVSSREFTSPDFNKLKPGDLLFWSGTYKTYHTPAISHVMLYLGKNKENQPLMFGASGGNSYGGKRLSGVSVFDFKLPSGRGKTKFVGYGCIPDVTC
jgi:hypothetical protein